MEKGWVLGNNKAVCKHCGHRLKQKESEDSVLLLCANAMCKNYWTNQGCEIIMMLK